MSSPQTTTIATELAQAADAIRGGERFLVTTHENPDGDALGSLLAVKLALDALGKDVVMYLSGETPLPREYSWMPLGNLRRSLPDDAANRVLLALDCANESRLGPDPEVLASAPLVLNVDHHHDNSRFGGVNAVVADASSTGEIVRDLLSHLDVELTPDMAEALYIALVTDTGRFQYEAATPETLRLAARLREHPFDHTRLSQVLYENNHAAYLDVLGVAMDRAELDAAAGLVWTYVLWSDLESAGAEPGDVDDLIDVLRATRDADTAALVKQQRDGRFKVSVRSRGARDLSVVAAAFGGGGHRLAAGYTSEVGPAETIRRLRAAVTGAASIP